MASGTGSISPPLPEISLDFYGVGVRIAGAEPGVLDDLRRDFSCFTPEASALGAPGATPAVFSWILEPEPRSRAPDIGIKFPILKTKNFTVYQRGNLRLIRYSDGPAASFDFTSGQGHIACASKERLRELAFLAVLSRVGEALDKRGLHRVHALGLEHGGQAALVLLPSGGGKSSLALEIFRRSPQTRFLSEDAPLVCAHGLVHPFPLRWSLRPDAQLGDVPERFIRDFKRERYGPKRLIDAEFFQERLGASAPLRRIFLGRRADGRPAEAAGASSWRAAAALAENLVVGRGVPQMAEYMAGLGPKTLGRLAPIAYSRARTALRLLRQSSVVSLSLGQSPAKGAQILLDCLGP
ncbi:MAG TPA: hypothetical protein VNK24_10775 [Elusimicrobiota bacterium]|nr:hypothetical protein [Elusimicrobiota bacterium]